MPTYDYKCDKCSNVFEQFQNITDEPIKKCPRCGGKVKRIIGAGSGIIFKGKGFYQTDYKPSSSVSGCQKDGKKDTPPCCDAGKCPVNS